MNNEKAALPGAALPESAAAKLPNPPERTAIGDSPAPLADAALSSVLRAYGLAKADENTEPDWKSCTDRVIEYLATSGYPFSADHVQALIPPADHPCRIGARFHAAVRAGVIRPTGYTLSTRPSRHRGVQRVYVGGDAR